MKNKSIKVKGPDSGGGELFTLYSYAPTNPRPPFALSDVCTAFGCIMSSEHSKRLRALIYLEEFTKGCLRVDLSSTSLYCRSEFVSGSESVIVFLVSFIRCNSFNPSARL